MWIAVCVELFVTIHHSLRVRAPRMDRCPPIRVTCNHLRHMLVENDEQVRTMDVDVEMMRRCGT